MVMNHNDAGARTTITVETKISAPIAMVWKAWTTPADIVRWNAASADWPTTSAKVDLRVGGGFSSRMEAKDGSFAFDFEGTYRRIVEHELIEFAMTDHRVVRIEFVAIPHGVHVRETFDAETMHSLEQQREGWQAILDSFKKHVEATVSEQRGTPPPGGQGRS